jgi:hypothetical protein
MERFSRSQKVFSKLALTSLLCSADYRMNVGPISVCDGLSLMACRSLVCGAISCPALARPALSTKTERCASSREFSTCSLFRLPVSSSLQSRGRI